LSGERVYAELTDAFSGHGRGRALRLLVELGLADVVLPECAAMDGVEQPPEYHPEGDVLTHVCMVLDHVPAGSHELAWSAVLHDIGKPPTFRRGPDRIRFDGHDVLSERMARDVLDRLRAPNVVKDAVADVCRQHIRFAALPQMRPVKAERWMREPRFPLHLEFHRADCLGSHGKLEIYELAKERFAALPPVSEPLLLGRDVLALGVPRGPQVGELLRRAQAALEELPAAPTREEALVLLRDTVARSLQDGDGKAR
jgi:poly(A) polymerase